MKMLSCCYCGARDVMTMGKGPRRSLTCKSCGAPVRKVEMIHADQPAPLPRKPPERIHKHKRTKHNETYQKKRKKKKRKGLLEKIWDEVDDIFDVDDWFD